MRRMAPRNAYLILIFFFSFHLLDLPYSIKTSDTQCCCSSLTICKCRHHNNSCSLKKKPRTDFESSKKICQAALPSHSSPRTLLKALGCGEAQSPFFSASASKEFDLHVFSLPSQDLKSYPPTPFSSIFKFPIFQKSFKRPPRLLF